MGETKMEQNVMVAEALCEGESISARQGEAVPGADVSFGCEFL